MSSRTMLFRRTLSGRGVTTLLAFWVYGCSDDGSNQTAPAQDAGVDAAVSTPSTPSTDDSLPSPTSSMSSRGNETSNDSRPELTSSADGPDPVDAAIDTSAASDGGSTTWPASSEATMSVDTLAADAGMTPIDWTDPPTGIDCVEPENCVNGAHALTAGYADTCAIESDGTLWCWGSANEMGSEAGCAVKTNGTVWCWGYATSSLFGPNSEVVELDGYTPVYQASEALQIPNLTDVKAVAIGYDHICALDEDGAVWCWGNNAFGQLGADGLASSATPVRVDELPPARQISSNGDSTCVVAVTGDVYCWGANSSGQLGDGSEVPEYAYEHPELFSATPLKVNGLDDIVKVTSHYATVCALASNGGVSCWGALNWVGLAEAPSSVPVAIAAWDGAKDISVGAGHACAIVADGRVSCVGDSSLGQLGAVSLDPMTPIFADGVDDAAMIAAGGYHTCVVHETGQLSCWGDDSDGQLGDGTLGLGRSYTPLPVLSDAAFVAVTIGESACGLKATGGVSCWGNNMHGELGVSPEILPVTATPRDIPALEDVTAISGGMGHFCAVNQDGTVSCWGDNTSGQLGDSTFTEEYSASPVAVEGLSGVVAIQSSFAFNCALLDGGTVSCWGGNFAGQLGRDANDVWFDATPTPVPGVTNAVELTVSMYNACVRHDNDDVTCWGGNYSHQFGPDSEDPSPPVAVAAMAGAESIAAGVSYVCRVNSDGTVACTGTQFDPGGEGDAGSDGGVDNSLITPIEGLTNVASISPGCALRNDGSIACWEDDSPRVTPLNDAGMPVLGEFAGLDAASYLNVSHKNADGCAVLAADSSLVCWGGNSYGQLGTGEMAWRGQPSVRPHH
jgi:alpha-tubulin suppressor-like RCC1 family protein